MTAAPPPQKSGPPIFKIACFGCIALVILSVLGCFGITAGAMSAIKSSSAYTQGMAMANADARVTDALGTPVEGSWFVGGSLEDSGATGSAILVTPLKGPKGEGVLTISATKANGKWKIDEAVVVIGATSEAFDLVNTGDGKTGEAKTGEAKTGETKTGEEASR
ncbi:MAG: hypothetical protein JKY65_18400 [Planctomycetes bacterium]|nr:hypothetical protein [Planctomycetota bacterium]